MAKRYKTRDKKKFNTKNIIIIAILFLAIIVVFNFGKNHEDFLMSDENEIDIPQYETLQSDLLKIGEIKEELKNIIEDKIKDVSLTKVTYQLKTLEDGTIYLEYYNKDTLHLTEINIDIKTKQITKIESKENVENDVKRRTIELASNCDEDIVADYNLKEKERNENKEDYINIIVTETEVAVNIITE